MTVQFDKALDIALGNSRKAKTWKNKPVRWAELLDRLSTTCLLYTSPSPRD